MLSRLLQGIKQGLTKYPVLTNSAIFGTMFVGAECLNQTLAKKILADQRQPYDTEHIVHCGIFGTTVQGPGMTVWYRWLDSKFAGVSLKIVSRKIFFDQMAFTPVLYVAFYVLMSIMERKDDVFEELIHKFPQTFATSCVFWIPVQAINFSLIPPLYRVTYMGAAAFIWVTILCWIKSQTYEKMSGVLKSVGRTTYSVLEVVICIHGVLQTILRRNSFVAKFLTYRFSEAALCVVTLFLSLYMNIMLCCIIFYFTLYRGLVHLYLKQKYESDYEGLLEGSDALWAIEDNSRGIVNGLMIIEHKANGDDFYAAMKEHVSNTLLRYAKFKCVRQQSFGYLFFLKNRVHDDDVVKKMDFVVDVSELSKDDLRKLLTTYCNAPLPYNDTATCEILIGTQSVRWRDNNSGKFQYPVLYRLHHCIGDGVALQNLIAKKMVDNYSGFLTENILNKMQTVDESTVQTKTFEKFVNSVKSNACTWYKKIGNILNMRAYQLSYLNPLEENVIHGPHLSGDKHFVLSVEDSPKYVSMVKDIKRRVCGATFSDVVLTAVARSFKEYFKKRKLESPTSISVALTIFPPNQDIKVLSSDDIDLTNRFSLGLIKLPMFESDNSSMKTLKYIKEDIESLKKGVDVLLNYWQIKILFGVLPAPVVRYLVNKADSTMALSNFPGTDGLTIMEGNKILDFLFWIPNKSRVGLGMSIYTYDNRFQLGLLVDKTVIQRLEDVQTILDDVFKNIHKLNEHTRHKNDIIL